MNIHLGTALLALILALGACSKATQDVGDEVLIVSRWSCEDKHDENGYTNKSEMIFERDGQLSLNGSDGIEMFGRYTILEKKIYINITKIPEMTKFGLSPDSNVKINVDFFEVDAARLLMKTTTPRGTRRTHTCVRVG